MYYSITEAVGTGSAVSVAVPPYIVKSHIKVYVDGLPTEGFDWVNDQTIMVVAPLNRLIRVVRRTSPDARLTRFLNGVPLPGETLEVDSKQAFFLAQEAYDLTLASGGSLGQNLGPGVELTTEGIKQLLAGQITPSLLDEQLRMEIGLVAYDETVAGSPAWRVAQEAAARAAALVAEAQARNAALLAEAAERGAAIQSETTERQAALESLAQQLVTLTASLNGANAAVQTEMTTRVNADEALGSRIDTVSASALDNAAAITAEANARANADNAIATAVEEVKAELEGADADLAARITSVESAYVDADEANAAAIQTVKASVDNDLSPRVAAVETTASTFASRVGTVESNYSLKVQARADGKFAFAGIGLSATAGGATPTQSEMVFAADKFTFVPSMADINVVPQPLLMMGLVNGVNTLVIPPSRYGDKLIEARMVVEGAIEARHLKVSGGGAAVNDDPQFADASAWEVALTPAGTPYGPMLALGTTGSGVKGATCVRSPTSAPYGSGSIRSKRPIAVAPGERYVLRVWICAVAAGNGQPNGNIVIRLGVSASETFAPMQEVLSTGEGLTLTAGWTEFRVEFTIPSGMLYAKPELLLNWGGTQGWHTAQDLRLERMLDSAVIVEGGIKADRIDTRGLTIKDAAGNIVMSAGTGLNWSNVSGSKPKVLEVHSAGYQAAVVPRAAGVYVDGVYKTGPFWWGFTVFNDDLSVHDQWTAGPGGNSIDTATSMLLSYLNSNTNRIICVATSDHPTGMYSDPLLNALYRCGASRGGLGSVSFLSTYRAAYALIGRFNSPEGSGIESFTRVASTYCMASAVVKDGVIMGAQKDIQVTPNNASTYIADAAIGLAQINKASIGSLSAITATIGTLRTATGGARTEIYDNVIKVYDSSNVLRVKLGNLDL